MGFSLSDVHDLMEVAVRKELGVPVGICESQPPAADCVVASRCFAEFPYVECSGGRIVALDAGRPLSTRAVGLDEFSEHSSFGNLRSVFAIPNAFFVTVLLGSPRRAVVQGLVAVVAHGVERLWIVYAEHSAFIALLVASTTGSAGRKHVLTGVEHENERRCARFATLADELVGLDSHGFEEGLVVV